MRNIVRAMFTPKSSSSLLSSSQPIPAKRTDATIAKLEKDFEYALSRDNAQKHGIE